MNLSSIRVLTFFTAISVIALVLTYLYMDPAPPKELTIATGGPRGGYMAFAKRYKADFEKLGIRLNIVQTAGSLENLSLLNSGRVDIAFVQSGTGDPAEHPDFQSLVSLYYEPMWVFVRRDAGIQKLSDLKGRRIAPGARQSGTWAVVRQLLTLNHIETTGDTILHDTTIGGHDALIEGRVDVLFLITSAASQHVEELLRHPDIDLLDISRAQAYAHKKPVLNNVTLYQGIMDFRDNIPTYNVSMLASAATLVSHMDLHPALQNLFVHFAMKHHSSGGVFEKAEEFPSLEYLDYPVSEHAQRYIEQGPPFLEKYLPFWAATMVDRMKILAIPILTLFLPLSKIVPRVYRWYIRKRVFRWNKHLIHIDMLSQSKLSQDELSQLENELNQIKQTMEGLNIPITLSDEIYQLHLTIEGLSQKLRYVSKA